MAHNMIFRSGTLLHFPSPSGVPCPTRSIPFDGIGDWTALDIPFFRQPDGRVWNTRFIPEHAKVQVDANMLEIKMSRDTKHEQMLSGAFLKSADMENGGIYEV